MAGYARRLPVGAEVAPDGGVHFRVWAPRRRAVDVVLVHGPGSGREVPMTPEPEGWFSAYVPSAAAGTGYRFRLDGGEAFPDPASRWQPEGPHGPSEVVDPSRYVWSDGSWRGISLPGQVLYELHVGTFTREGTYRAAADVLPDLADVGITCVELMPVAEFSGRWGWGYDGVDWMAPTRLYGPPDDLRVFVDRAHALGIGVVLDVVFNHFGPDGNYTGQYAEGYVSRRYRNDWGDAINFDGPDSGPVRELVLATAQTWIEEYHLDGFRIDATQDVHDVSPRHIVADVAARAREAAGGRSVVLIGENEPQQARLVRPPSEGGHGLDALWNDDLHHSATVALTGRGEAYYQDTRGTPQELISAVKRGFLFQGQWYSWQEQRRGTPALDIPATRFVAYLQNHDQIANSASGLRVSSLAAPPALRAMTALLLLAPWTPMLFQGQEYGATTPFLYFVDHHEGLRTSIRDGRRDFLAQFPSIASPAAQERLADPSAPSTFERSKLDPDERRRNVAQTALHRDLLRLRRDDPVFRGQRGDRVDGAVLGPEALVLRFFGDDGDDRLLLLNLGRDLSLRPAPEPLLAPPEGRRWRLLWSSEHPDYGGTGTPDPEDEERGWLLPGRSALVMAPAPDDEESEDG